MTWPTSSHSALGNWDLQFLIAMARASAGKRKEIEEAAPPSPIQEFNIPIPSEVDEVSQEYFKRCKIQRVPRHLLRKVAKEDLYTPKMVSFGPYHYGLPHLHATEEYKPEIVSKLVSESGQTREVFYNRIFKVIDQVRNCYIKVTKYDDNKLANMMLQDACFAIYLIQISLQTDMHQFILFKRQFGLTVMFAFTDMVLLENQIPFGVVKLLVDLIYTNKEERSKLLYKFTCSMRFAFPPPPGTIKEFKTQPIHFLDALHQLCIEKDDSQGENSIQPVSKCQWVSAIRSWSCLQPHKMKEDTNESEFEKLSHQSRSVTELKAKGISFRPTSFCLKDIKFKSFICSGELQLPVWFLSEFSPKIFGNITAYEATSPESDFNIATINYVNFLKSLIVKPEDAKELRENKILFSSLNSDEEVVEIIKDVDTWGYDTSLFNDVKWEIGKHCNNKGKTWMAELYDTYFRSPWSIIALLSAIFLLILSVIQAYYAMNPKNPDTPSAT